MDSITQFWCQKVGLSRLFWVILRNIFGPSKCDWQRAKPAIVRFLVAHYFSVQTKKYAAFGCPGIHIYRLYNYIIETTCYRNCLGPRFAHSLLASSTFSLFSPIEKWQRLERMRHSWFRTLWVRPRSSRRAKVNIEVNVKEPQKFGESEDESRDVERLICDPLWPGQHSILWRLHGISRKHRTGPLLHTDQGRRDQLRMSREPRQIRNGWFVGISENRKVVKP